ncbi:hypothetical protein HNR19_003835 [Nocardioides thalensis]|uniref:Uncharacterized protein n=1 Tax=Nocardioides thalensis TaxID=1914755 RepID=A0A853C761_9ACTN|nr:hypothetical protein [Nocardioides thalensis]NYJ03137.1 hypothetical protein [Nocardioides thalensis]
MKTHRAGWAYRVLAPGVYYWRGRTGEQWLVTPGGTYALDTQPCPGPAKPTDPPDE